MTKRIAVCATTLASLSALGVSTTFGQTTHNVDLIGVTFVEQNITVEIGDTIHWEWISGGFHNVESGGVVGGVGVPDGSFRSGDATSVVGTTFDLLVDQEFVDNNPTADNVYDYYCVVHAAVDMVGSFTIASSDCASDEDCDDGEACNGVETCQDTTCVGGTAMDCDDNDECTEDSCTDGTCGNAAIEGCCGDDADCDDSNDCTTDACTDGVCGNAAIDGCCSRDADCNDDDDCTDDACTDGACTNAAITGCGGGSDTSANDTPVATSPCGAFGMITFLLTMMGCVAIGRTAGRRSKRRC